MNLHRLNHFDRVPCHDPHLREVRLTSAVPATAPILLLFDALDEASVGNGTGIQNSALSRLILGEHATVSTPCRVRRARGRRLVPPPAPALRRHAPPATLDLVIAPRERSIEVR